MLSSLNRTTERSGTTALSLPGIFLRLEGLTLFAVSIVVYGRLDFAWWPFALFLLAPDLSALGYLGGPRPGAFAYNTVHALVLPVLLLTGAWVAGSALGIQVALIWLAHIGMDRTVGYGLKYPDAFKHTHLDEPSAPAGPEVSHAVSQPDHA
jgi:hypothetical protein